MSEKEIEVPTINMAEAEAEAVIISEMEKFRSIPVEKVTDPSVKHNVEECVKEMRLMVSLMREKRLEEGSCRLRCLISEIVEMASAVHHRMDVNINHSDGEMSSLWWMLTETNKRLRELGAGLHENAAAADTVGLEEDVEHLLCKINDQKQQHFTVCIEGIAGSGKTTLARELYMNARVVDEFARRVWVSCGGFLSEKELLINIMQQVAELDGEGEVEMQRAHLQQMLIQQLQGKRYFIVLDDIRGLYSFQTVIDSLQNEVKGRSILLLTCRIANNSFITDYFHDMKPLDLDESWQLLLNMILSSNNQFPKHVVRRGKLMLMKHSGGLPLAVKEVAMEWLEKRRLGIEWEEVVESEDLELRASLEAIESSVYQNMDPYCQLFFLHLGFFKQGTTIRASRLLQTWIASGALELEVLRQEMDYESLITVFIGHKIIAVKNKDKYDEMKNFDVGAIFHKLSIKKINEGTEGASHRVVHFSRHRERFNCSNGQNERLICVSFNGGGCLDASPSYWKSFKQLRVLEFEGFGLKFLPEVVGELIQLRYLGLRDNYIQELPSSLGSLKNLEVLDIALNFMVKVPDILWEMEALVHLYMSDIICEKPLKIGELKNLHTLTYISVDNWAYEISASRMMTKLHKLGITEMDECSDAGKLFASLAALKGLKSLVLRGSCFRSMPSLDELGVLRRLKILKLDGFITKLPSPENFPPHLCYLTLVNSCVDEDPMLILEKLNIKYLKLWNAYTGQEMMISQGGFPNVEHLCIGELWHVRNLQVAQGSLMRLRKLEITNCPYLRYIPKEIITERDLELNIMATKNIATKDDK